MTNKILIEFGSFYVDEEQFYVGQQPGNVLSVVCKNTTSSSLTISVIMII